MSSPRAKSTICLVLSGALLSLACSGALKTLGGLNALHGHLKQKYQDEVAINLQNSRFLSITFINSSLNKSGPDERAARALEAAVFTARNYEDIKSIQQIWISFVASQTRFVFFHYSQGLDSFGFDRNGTPLGDDVRTPVARFSADRNQTDVSITRIQLEGNMNKGIAMVPHFTVAGDARRAGSAAVPPESVDLDFASYAPKPVFAQDAKLEIYCDDRLILKGLAQLRPSGDSSADSTIAQFLSTRFSFRAFQKMGAARSVKIKLESKTFELSPADIDALAGMSSYGVGPSAP